MGKLLRPKEMGAELVREFVQCEPTDRIRIADGYASHVEAYAMAKVVEHLETFREIMSQYSLKESKEILESVIKELKTGKSAAGTTEGISGKLVV